MMAQVNVLIAGRTYRMACADGEEDHLKGLAARLDGKIVELRGSFGEIGDGRITVMAAITMADDLSEAERRIAALEARNSRSTAPVRRWRPNSRTYAANAQVATTGRLPWPRRLPRRLARRRDASIGSPKA